MRTPSVVKIVHDQLLLSGYGGLWNPSEGCACEVGALSPRRCLGELCRAGYKTECTCKQHDFHIVEMHP
jgi:hypothetical protein